MATPGRVWPTKRTGRRVVAERCMIAKTPPGQVHDAKQQKQHDDDDREDDYPARRAAGLIASVALKVGFGTRVSHARVLFFTLVTEHRGQSHHLNDSNRDKDSLRLPESARLTPRGAPERLSRGVPKRPRVVALPDFAGQHYLRLADHDARPGHVQRVALPDLHLPLSKKRGRTEVD